MTLKQFIYLLPRLVKYNLKIIFAGTFIWFHDSDCLEPIGGQ